MNDLTIFTFHDQQGRSFMLDEEPCFTAPDLCSMLGIRNVTNALRPLDEDQKGLYEIKTLGGNQTVNYVTESGMYLLVFRSNKPVGHELRRFLSREVLPKLRKDGTYTLPGHEPAQSELADAPDLIDPARLTAGVAVVREARRLFGVRTARAIWTEVGLPLPGHNPLALDDIAVEQQQLAAMIADWIRGNNRFTTAECAIALGLADPRAAPAQISPTLRARIATILRAAGWAYKNTKFANGIQRWTWHTPWIDIDAAPAGQGESVQ